MRRLSALAAAHDFLLVVDDTIASFGNVDLLHREGVTADLLCSSLTKACDVYHFFLSI
jgi:cystathionine beta-lyase/cystathionine gamma-synthase